MCKLKLSKDSTVYCGMFCSNLTRPERLHKHEARIRILKAASHHELHSAHLQHRKIHSQYKSTLRGLDSKDWTISLRAKLHSCDEAQGRALPDIDISAAIAQRIRRSASVAFPGDAA